MYRMNEHMKIRDKQTFYDGSKRSVTCLQISFWKYKSCSLTSETFVCSCAAFLQSFYLVWNVPTPSYFNAYEGTTPCREACSTASPFGSQAYLDEGESSSWLQRLVFILQLIGHILLHTFLLVDLPLCHHVEEGTRGDGDGDGIPGFGLRREDGKFNRENSGYACKDGVILHI